MNKDNGKHERTPGETMWVACGFVTVTLRHWLAEGRFLAGAFNRDDRRRCDASGPQRKTGHAAPLGVAGASATWANSRQTKELRTLRLAR